MDRKIFRKLVDDIFYDIVKDEVKYLKKTGIGYVVYSLFDIKDENPEEYEQLIGELYFLYDKHKLQFKDYLDNHNVSLDRHKLAVIFLCILIDYKPILFYSKYKGEARYTQDMLLANYRVAFRCACAYASSALFNSFLMKIEELNHKCETNDEESIKERQTYLKAIETMKENGTYYFPRTRKPLETYVDNLIRVLYQQFSLLDEDQAPPYCLLADTFYWIDVYNKLQLGLEVKPEEYPNGLSRNDAPTDNNQSQAAKELTVTEDTETAKAKKSKGKKK